MATIRIELKPFLQSILAVGLLEAVGVGLAGVTSLDSLILLGLLRIVEVVTLGFIIYKSAGGLETIGFTKKTAGKGLIQGVIWSVGFGLTVLLIAAAMSFFNVNFFSQIRMDLPGEVVKLICFFLVGGFIGPVAEEIFFRGVVFGFFRRWGFWAALIISTGLFMAVHLVEFRMPLTQAIGGVLFAFAYEKSGNLITPIVIHVLGNLSIFCLQFVTISQ